MMKSGVRLAGDVDGFLEARVADDEDRAAIQSALKALAARTSYLFRR